MAVYTVLGSRGYVGSALVRSLLAAGIEPLTPERVDERVFDRDLGRVFYCIGLTADYAARPFDTVEAHVTVLARLLQKASFERLVYLSSTRLYDSAQGGLAVESAPLQMQPSNPRNLYDLSKGLGENLCLNFSAGRACVARLSSVYDSADGSPGFLSGLLRRLRTEQAFEIDSSPAFQRDYVLLDDVVLALKAMLDRGSTGIFNVASGENVSNQQIAEVLARHGRHLGFRRNEPQAAVAVCDVARLRSLGVSPMPVRAYLDAFLKGAAGC